MMQDDSFTVSPGRKRNEKIYIEVSGMFYGSLSQYEDCFGYLSELNDEQVVQHARDWARELNCDFKAIL